MVACLGGGDMQELEVDRTRLMPGREDFQAGLLYGLAPVWWENLMLVTMIIFSRRQINIYGEVLNKEGSTWNT